MAGASSPASIDALLDYLKQARGFDFTGYKRPSLERRIAKRMDAAGVEAHADYVDYLEVHPAEFAELFNTILINVTGFFRDGAAWTYLADEVVPRVLEARGAEPVRVWCAGCASGEEAYTMAMVLAEALGEDAYARRVKIYATDVDEEALEAARHGRYPVKALEPVAAGLRERYFERSGATAVFRRDLRRTVIFGLNDLVQDAPISRVDLLTCRNTLMYFNVETQERILRRFNFALRPDGYLFLGKSEMLISHANLFTPVNRSRRVFTKVPGARHRERPFLAALTSDAMTAGTAVGRAAIENAPAAQVAVDAEGRLVLANSRARALLGISHDDVGRPLRDLEASYRPVDIRAAVLEVLAAGSTLTLPLAEVSRGRGERLVVEAQVTPLKEGAEILGASLAYVDRTQQASLKDELDGARKELDTAYEELQSAVEELETTNEELQSTNEELETTNEELRRRTAEVVDVNAFMEAILSTIGVAVMVLDLTQHVQVWNAFAEDLWGLRVEEAEGAHVLDLDFGLPGDALRAPLHQALTDGGGRTTAVLDAIDRRGRRFACRMTVRPTDVSSRHTGVVVLMERSAGGTAAP